MPQEFNLEEAIKMAIQTEKNVMDFYLRAADITKNERAKKVFETLAREEREHAANFFHIYSGKELGSFDDLGDYVFQVLDPFLRFLFRFLKVRDLFGE